MVAPGVSKRASKARAGTDGDDRIRNACTECKRRKVKCDGQEPCYFCKWYRHPDRCNYTSPTPRPGLTRRAHDSLQSRLRDTTSVLERLFPLHTPEQLLQLSRDELIALAQHLNTNSGALSSQHMVVDDDDSGTILANPTTTTSSASAYPTPSLYEYNESVDNLEGREAVADDVNSLNASSTQTSSYVGSSSAAAGVRLLFHLAPDAASHQPKNPANQPVHRPPAIHDKHMVGYWDKGALVRAYFEHVHPTTPILDQDAFMVHFTAGKRSDSPWLALLNMVLALGTIAYTTSDRNDDIHFYKAAKSHLGLDSLGSGHLETLQALILIGGWYLQYRNRPNTASAIMGAAMRMAYALGLHKDGGKTSESRSQYDLGRRIWSSLIVLDSGEGLTLGRVSSVDIFNAHGNSLTPPGLLNLESSRTPSVYSVLLAYVAFSRQACKIHQRLIETSELTFADTLAFDAHLTDWYDTLPSFMRLGEPCPPWLRQPRSTLKWRLDNLRLMMNRPILISAIMHGVPFEGLDRDRKVCIRKCQSIATQVMDEIGCAWGQDPVNNQYFGWPACWYLFQASVIPLLSLFGFPDDSRQSEWHEQVTKVEILLQELEPWSIAARQTHVLVASLHEAQRLSASTRNAGLACRESSKMAESQTTQQLPMQATNYVPWTNILDSSNSLFSLPGPSEFEFDALGTGMSTWDIPIDFQEWL